MNPHIYSHDPTADTFDNNYLITTNESTLKDFLDTSLQPSPQQLDYQSPQSTINGVYSDTGFDMINILMRLASRPNPRIQLGPIDLSCAFVVSDPKQYDCPVIYSSPAFERLTGYTNNDIVGKNCRFLQSPDGYVTGGSRRQHTDNQAVYYLKEQISQGKEHQASIINYKKGGQPFVNLVTVIPLLNESGELDYLVGLQVDLVEQPNSILEKMKNGTYLVNYHVPNYILPYKSSNEKLLQDSMDEYFQEFPRGEEEKNETDIMALLGYSETDDTSSVTEKQIQKEWNQLLLDQSCDFIHVLSLKGVFLYASNSSIDILEYKPEELLGRPLSTICHPSDIVPVMRELKESANHPDKSINILFRIRRKNSGYMWIDCQGKLHMDQNKGRKCLVLSGRERSVYRLMEWQVRHLPVIKNQTIQDGPKEFWAKLSLGGLYLHVTDTCKYVLGFSSDSLEYESIYQYIESDSVTTLTQALELAKQGKITKAQYTMLNSKGHYMPVITTFFPGDDKDTPSFLLSNTRFRDEDVLEPLIKPTDILMEDGRNLFAQLETTRTTNWQYELHQLKLSSKKLKEELEYFQQPKKSQRRKRKTYSLDSQKICAQCQRRDTPEWRKGPNGLKELCNACGLRYSKRIQQGN